MSEVNSKEMCCVQDNTDNFLNKYIFDFLSQLHYIGWTCTRSEDVLFWYSRKLTFLLSTEWTLNVTDTCCVVSSVLCVILPACCLHIPIAGRACLHFLYSNFRCIGERTVHLRADRVHLDRVHWRADRVHLRAHRVHLDRVHWRGHRVHWDRVHWRGCQPIRCIFNWCHLVNLFLILATMLCTRGSQGCYRILVQLNILSRNANNHHH